MFVSALGCALLAPTLAAQAPPNYYLSVDASNPASLRATLHAVIDDHTRFPYTASSTDTWDILELADQNPNNASQIVDVYKNAAYAKSGGGNTNYNREHSWPMSYGFPVDTGSNYPYTDCHQLFLVDIAYNGSRGNNPFRACNSGCTEFTTLVNNGSGGGAGVFPGNSNWLSGSGATGTWQTWNARKGDIARALFYLDVRYEGGTHGVTGAAEPNLILTDNESLIASSNTGSNLSVAYMGMLSVLIQWHAADPVDARELVRNDRVFQFQGNRNPFVDHPEWVGCLFSGVCSGDVTPPAAPTGLGASGGNASVTLDWSDNSEPDLAGYVVYRGTSLVEPLKPLQATPLANSQFTDLGVVNFANYFYRVAARDTTGNESALSARVSAKTFAPPPPPPGGALWINELHYDNNGGDTGEGVEIAGAAGTVLSGWKLVAYNGSDGSDYATVQLSGTLGNAQAGYGVAWFAVLGLQNGAPDGIALVNPSNAVVQFLSYEGAFTATSGAASGMLSTDIGVSELGTTPVGQSLRLTGTGNEAGDFVWAAPAASSVGTVNANQVFVP